MTLHVEADADLTRSATPMLLLHGFTQDASAWNGVRRQLKELAPGVATAAVDLPGHGRSPAPTDPAAYSLDACATALVATLDRLGLEKAWIVGYSMGGRAALHLAVHHKERVAGLVLLSTTAGLESEEERAARAASDEALAQRIENEGVEAFIDFWLQQPMMQSLKRLSAEDFADLRQRRLASRAEGLAGSLRGMGTGKMAPLWRRLPQLELPALVLAGELDERYVIAARRLARMLFDTTMRILPNMSHSLLAEADRDVALAISRFLETLGSPR